MQSFLRGYWTEIRTHDYRDLRFGGTINGGVGNDLINGGPGDDVIAMVVRK